MTSKIWFILLFFLPSLSAFAYDRKCDKTIGVENYLHAGSMDNNTPGGKTYNFVKIVSALENEVLGSRTGNEQQFTCLDTLFEKAKLDSSTYWQQRLYDGRCAVDSGIPAVKPESCDQDLWDKFNESMNHIDAVGKRKAALLDKCKAQGNKCSDTAGIQGLQDLAEPLAATQMDNCCDVENGPAFRVLRSTYTIEFSKHSDSELQKECYKRTRPNQANGAFSLSGLGGCLGGAIKAIAESGIKLLKGAAGLLDFGMWTELMRVLGKAMVTSEGRADLQKRIGVFLEEVGKQIFSQAYATTSCFSGEYGAEQTCRLVSGLVSDWILGGKLLGLIVKLVSTIGKPISVVASLAKSWVAENPAAQALKTKMTNISAAAKNVKVKTQVAAKATTATARESAALLVSKMKPYTSIRKMVNDGLKQMRDKAKAAGREVAESKPAAGPNASAVVSTENAAGKAGASAEQAAVKAVPEPTSSSSIGSSGTYKINKELVASKSEINSLISKSSNKAVPADDVFGPLAAGKKVRLNKADKIKAIDKNADLARDKVRNLYASGQYTETQATNAMRAIDKIHDRVRAKYGEGPRPQAPVASAETQAPRLADDAASGTQGRPFSDAETPAPATAAPRLADDATLNTQGELFEIPKPSSTRPAATESTVGVESSATKTSINSGPINLPTLDVGQALGSAQNLSSRNAAVQQRLSQFMQSAQTEAGKAAPNMRSVYKGQGDWTITRESIRRHAEVETMYRNGVIDGNKASAMHNIIEVTERNARGSSSAYGRDYIKLPTTAVPTSAKIFSATSTAASVAKPAAKVTAGVGTTQYLASQNYENLTDPRYNTDTLERSFKIADQLSSDKAAVAKKFAGLKTEEEIMDAADELRTHAVTVQRYISNYSTPNQKQEIADLVNKINFERNKALARLGLPAPIEKPAVETRQPAAPASATTPAPTATPEPEPEQPTPPGPLPQMGDSPPTAPTESRERD